LTDTMIFPDEDDSEEQKRVEVDPIGHELSS
jgi:hypothetical protein